MFDEKTERMLRLMQQINILKKKIAQLNYELGKRQKDLDAVAADLSRELFENEREKEEIRKF